MKTILRWSAKLLLLAALLSCCLVLPLRWLHPPTTAFMLQDTLRHDRPVSYWWLPLADISSNLAIAVVAAEDQKFPYHHGFDLVQIRSVLDQAGAPARGASTISQQLAKNLYLWPGKSYLRKGLEAWLTLWLELLLPKERILALYLNVAQFGPGIYGAGAGSRLLLGVDADRLTPQQAARLAAVLPNPLRLSAARPSPYVWQRSREIQRQVRQLGGSKWLSNL